MMSFQKQVVHLGDLAGGDGKLRGSRRISGRTSSLRPSRGLPVRTPFAMDRADPFKRDPVAELQNPADLPADEKRRLERESGRVGIPRVEDGVEAYGLDYKI